MRLSLSRALLAWLIVITVAASVSAAELSLNDCIDLALKNRASIIQARGAEELAKASQRSALGAFLPNISGSYSYSKGKETNIEPADDGIDEQDIGPSKTWQISGYMSVVDFTNWFGYAQARVERQASRLDVIKSEQDLVYAVKLTYYAYLAAVQNVDVQKDAVARSEEQLKLIQSRYDLGSASLSDVLKQKVQYGNDKLSYLKAINSVVTSKAELAYTIGVDPNSDVNFSTDYTVREYQVTLDEALSFGVGHEPGLLSAQKNLGAAGHGVKAGWAQYFPTLSISGSYSKFNGTQAYPVAFDYSSNTLHYGFSVSLNIFDGFVREQRLTSAKVQRNNAAAALADTRNLVIREIKTAYYDIEQQREAKKVASETVAASTEDLKITQEKYNLGAATILDLLDAQVSLKQSQVSLIQADFNLNLSIAQLENAMGKM